jgi:hypothetical protein
MAKEAPNNMMMDIVEKMGAFTLGLSQTVNILKGVSPMSIFLKAALRIGATVNKPASLSKTV